MKEKTTSMVRVTRLMAAVLVVALLFGSFLGPVAGRAQTPDADATPVVGAAVDVQAALDTLLAEQQADGSFLGFSGEADPGTTIDALLALVAADRAGLAVGDRVERALSYLEGDGLEYAEIGWGQRAKLVIAVRAAGGDAFSFAGEDLWDPIEATLFEDGIAGDGMFTHALVTLAAVAVGSERAEEFANRALEYLTDDGGWGFGRDLSAGSADTNTTALMIQALVAAGVGNAPEVDVALRYLFSARAADGGYGYQPGPDGVTEADANSTGFVIQTLLATGFPTEAPRLAGDLAALATFQNPDGSFRYLLGDDEIGNLFALVQALPAALGVTYVDLVTTPGVTDAATPVAA